MDQTEISTMAECKSQVEPLVTTCIKMESMIATQVARPLDQLVAWEIPTLVEDSLDYLWQCAYEKTPTETRSVVYSVVELSPI